MFNSSFKDRFWSKVEMIPFHECWEWTASVLGHGYGQLSRDSDGNMIKAHRASYILHFGDIPAGMQVCHKCDNPRCVRPEHLFIGTSQDNHNDQKKKNRQLRGEDNPPAKLSASQVIEIRGSKLPTKDISKKYGVSESNIRAILTRKSWKHI